MSQELEQLQNQVRGLSAQCQVLSAQYAEANQQITAYRTNLHLTQEAHQVLVKEVKRLTDALSASETKARELQEKLNTSVPVPVVAEDAA